MSFLFPLALGLLLLAALPIVAHALRRGARTEVRLPTARFSPARVTSTKQRSYLEDRSLLLLRIALIILLALLAASPLARCSGPALSRKSGGSLAVALIVDDSGSMQVKDKGGTRFERAVATALDLLQTSREGDSFVLILAGAPARIAVPRTTHVEDVRQALNSLRPTERDTDLNSALSLAESSLRTLPQPEKHIAVLSDLATSEPLQKTSDSISLTFPLPELSQDYENCAILSAHRENSQVVIETECTSQAALEGRQVRVVVQKDSGSNRELSSLPFTEEGSLRLALPAKLPELNSDHARYMVELTRSPHDELSADDKLEIALGDELRYVAVFADRVSAGVETSDKTVVELALEALALDESVRPLSSLPEKFDELRDVSLLIIDNPAGFRPETQNALEAFVSEGGVLLTFLGPAVDSAPLSAGFWPITKSSPHYRPLAKDQNQVVSKAPDQNGDLARGYDTLRPRRRVTLEPSPQSSALLSFQDGSPLLLERPVGLGRVFTSTLPASVDESDFALRPAFLAILDQALEASRGQSSARVSLPGATWSVPESVEVYREREKLETFSLSPGLRAVTPELAGRYSLRSGKLEQSRFVTRHPGEHVREPQNAEARSGTKSSRQALEKTPISREVALALLALSAGELWLRSRRSRSLRSPAIGP